MDSDALDGLSAFVQPPAKCPEVVDTPEEAWMAGLAHEINDGQNFFLAHEIRHASQDSSVWSADEVPHCICLQNSYH